MCYGKSCAEKIWNGKNLNIEKLCCINYLVVQYKTINYKIAGMGKNCSREAS